MLKFSHLYQNETKFIQFLESNNPYKNYPFFVKIISSSGDKEQALSLAKEIKENFPNSTVFGTCSSEAVLYNGLQMREKTMILFEHYVTSDLITKVFSYENKTPAELAKEIYSSYIAVLSDTESPVHILIDGYDLVYDFLNEFNKFSPLIKLVGGCVGSHLDVDNFKGFLLDETGFFENSIYTYVATGKDTHHFVNVSTSQEPISQEYKITKMSGCYIDEIEGVEGLKWMYDFLSLTKDDTNDYNNWQEIANLDYLTHFPIILEDDKSGRFTRIDEETGKLSLYTSNLYDNTKFRVGYVNPSIVVKDTYNLCAYILDIPSENLFCYSCYFRKLFLKNCAQWEVTPFINNDICGIFLWGEIGYKNGRNSLYNGAYVFSSFSEVDKYVIPDYIALEKNDVVSGDDNFLLKAAEKQRENILSSSTNIELINAIKANDVNDIERRNIDNNTGLPNVFQFEIDNKSIGYNKVCFVESQTADIAIAFMGLEKFYAFSKELLDELLPLIFKKFDKYNLKLYLVNYKTLLFTCDNEVDETTFIDICKFIHKSYGYATSQNTAITNVSRLVLLLNRNNPIECGMNMLLKIKDSQETFIVCDNDYFDLNESNQINDLKGIELLKRAIDRNCVTPFYQGIYNNDTNCIDKYEALIRIVDVDGKIYSPFTFLDIAKKYKFYNKISMLMIEKVLVDFRNRDESVSINISKYDIISSKFRHWLIEQLKAFPNPRNIVIEFLETEDFSQLDVLFEFIEKIHSIGAKIAIDDFGSGYSTFTSIVSIKPDFIKIDGSIIKDLVNNSDNQIVLDSICYLAGRMNADTVAEFVENDVVQKYVKNKGINFSQGYFFAKPKPIDEID